MKLMLVHVRAQDLSLVGAIHRHLAEQGGRSRASGLTICES